MISVIMPVYNAGKYIKDAIDSVLCQTYPNFEFIIVNDGSTDNTESIIAEYHDSRIVLHSFDSNKGITEALNWGLIKAQGEYIARMDGDDIMFPERLQKQLHVMKSHSEVVLCSSFMTITNQGKDTEVSSKVDIIDLLYELQYGNCIFHPTVMLRKSFLDKYQLKYQDYPGAEDYKLWFEIAKKEGRIHVIPESLMYYRLSEDQVSSRHRDIQKETSGKIRNEIEDYILKNYPKISVVMPVYNCEEFVGEAILSILSQTFTNFEFIIVNDGSTDRSLEIINSFNDKRVHVINLEENRGNYPARNIGLSKVRGKYVCVMDADDVALPHRLQVQYDFMENNLQYLAAGSDIIIFDKIGSVVLRRESEFEKIKVDIRKDNVCTHPSLIIRREVFAHHGVKYNEEYVYSSDYNLMIDISKIGPITNIPEILLKYRAHGNKQISFGKKKEQDEYRLQIIQNQFSNSQKEINLFLMDISNENASGVKRYLEVLTQGLKAFPHVKIHNVKFVLSSITFFREEVDGYTIGLDFKKGDLLNSYREYLFYMTSQIFTDKSNVILHLHTINLMEYALFIKSRINCRIISHLHCIPWKGYFNIDKKKFFQLYSWWEKGITDKDLFIDSKYETYSYLASDKVICVTKSGADFVKKTTGVNVEIIANGMEDTGTNKRCLGDYKFLFVGGGSYSKGLLYVLEALTKVRNKGYYVELNVAGFCNEKLANHIKEKYTEMQVNLLGTLSFEQMKEQYVKNHIGLIASLQEQCSYVAIEMLMFGLPIVSTAIDGLDEMLSDRVNALKVKTVFSPESGLFINTEEYSDKIIELITDTHLRKTLSTNARKHYKENYTVEKMILKTVDLYESML